MQCNIPLEISKEQTRPYVPYQWRNTLLLQYPELHMIRCLDIQQKGNLNTLFIRCEYGCSIALYNRPV